jgi:pimeloyl-ACP methyl ester carboxylesterase
VGARPRGRAAYRSRELVDDVCALLDLVGGSAHLVGHDWGAAVGWALAAEHPERVLSWTAVSVGHPAAFLRSLRTPEQLRRSWYMGLFQLPRLPDWHLRSEPFIRGFLGRSGMTNEMLETYRREIVADGALTYALNWYRAIRCPNVT